MAGVTPCPRCQATLTFRDATNGERWCLCGWRENLPVPGDPPEPRRTPSLPRGRPRGLTGPIGPRRLVVPPGFVTMREVGARLGCGRSTVVARIRDRGVPTRKLKGCVLVTTAGLAALLLSVEEWHRLTSPPSPTLSPTPRRPS